MLRLPPALLLALATFLAACNTEAPNPFAGPSVTAPPPPGSALLFTSDASTGGGREVFAAAEDGSGLKRLTFCNTGSQRCDVVEAAPGPGGLRIVERRIANEGEPEGLVFVDLARSVEARLLPASAAVSGIDWSPTDDILVYSGVGEGGLEDLFRMDLNGGNLRPLTSTPAVRERRPRIDPSGSVACYERIAQGGKGEIWIFRTGSDQVRVTAGGSGSEPLPASPYVVGADADPDYSPDGRSLVFRRLTATGNGGLGVWDVMSVGTDGGSPSVIATGPVYRGAPDWGAKGITFVETDSASGTSQLVIVQADGSGRRVVETLGSGLKLSYPRWLP